MKPLLLLLTICMLSGINNYLHAQELKGQALIDSLLLELPKQKEDTNKANLLNALSHEYINSNPDEGIRYSFESLTLSKKLNWKKGLAFANLGLAYNYKHKQDYAKELEHYIPALRLFEEIGDKRQVVNTNRCIGDSYCNQSDFKKSLTYYFKSLKLAEQNDDKSNAAIITGSIGKVYGILDESDKSIEYLQKACDYFKEVDNKVALSVGLFNIGVLYYKIHNSQKSLEYISEALKLAEETDFKALIGPATAALGSLYDREKNYTMALNSFRKAIKISEQVGDKEHIAQALNNIGNVYWNILNDTTAHKDQMSNAVETMQNTFQQDGSIPKGKKALLATAIDHFERSLAIVKELKSYGRMKDCYKMLMLAYEYRGDYKKALEASDNYHSIQDSLYSQENKEEILKMGMKNEYDRQRLADSLKTAEKQKIAAINLKKQKNYTYMGFAGILLLAGFSFFIVKERGKSEKARKQSDELLLNILPEEVAAELKTTGGTTAKHYDNVTVLFTDFVDFTQAGEKMTAQNLIDELHSCFKAFDAITSKYGIEKIKTIGDAYLAVAGLPTADPKHAENVVRAATEINAFMQDRESKLGNKTFQIRIGIHSGSVVAGIVGVKKFAYDIWGDTVNTAARMEQNSVAGKINISQTTYELVQDKFTCSYRGELEAKNKGMLKMYFVEA